MQSAEDGAPIAGAVVLLNHRESGWDFRATTDAAGRYEIVNLPAGRYLHAVVQHPGHLLTGSTYGELSSLGGRIADVVLAQGETLRVDFTLARAGTIEGHVYDEQGEPVHNARVSLLQRPYTAVSEGYVRFIRQRSASTDDRGYYRFEDLKHEAYFVEAEAPATPAFQARYAPDAVYPSTFYPGGDGLAARPVRISARAPEYTADITLRPVRAMTVAGTAMDVRGEPLAGRTVTVQNPLNGRLDETRVPIGANGEFRVIGLPSGAYVLRMQGRCCGSDRQAYAFTTITPADASREDVQIVMAPEVRVSGRVVGLPSGAAGVRVRTMSEVPGLVPDRGGPVDADGMFEFSLLPVLTQFELRGLPPGWYMRSVRTRAGEAADGVIDARRGVDIRDVEISVSDRVGHLQGTVTGVRGVASERILVTIFALDDADGAFGPRIRQALTADLDEQGRFEFRDLAPGQYHVAARHDLSAAQTSDPMFLKFLRSESVPVTVHEAVTSNVTVAVASR